MCAKVTGGRICISVLFSLFLYGRGVKGRAVESQPSEARTWGSGVAEGSEGRNGSIMTSLFLLLVNRLRGSSLH